MRAIMCHTGAIQPLEKLGYILMRESMKQLNDSSGLSQKSFSPQGRTDIYKRNINRKSNLKRKTKTGLSKFLYYWV